MQISLPKSPPKSPHPILNLGFRIFFVSASVFAVLSMLVWYALLHGYVNLANAQGLPLKNVPMAFYWHAHEMLYGYACAVIAGFLLTAVKTWTSQPMPYGWSLFGIFLPWAMARLMWLALPLVSADATLVTVVMWLAGLMDMLFWTLCTFAVIRPVWKVKQKRQIGIVAKLSLLWVSQLLFYVGVLMGQLSLQKVGLYLGLYLIIGVVLTIGRRVLPFFIERGVDEEVTLKNSALLDKLSLVSFFVFMLVDVFWGNAWLLSLSALAVAVINGLRLLGWHTKGIWKKPLLWSLYGAFIAMCLGFVLFAVQPWLGFSHSLPVHVLALSGIGLMTLAMMSRVSLGHTGRNIHQPSPWVTVLLLLMTMAVVIRGLLPIVLPNHYMTLITLSQGLWVVSFLIFLVIYLPILSKPRPDGLFG